MAKPELGTKRQCQSCGAKFYDLNKDPILCPKCGAAFVAVALTARGRAAEAVAARRRRGRGRGRARSAGGPELVSLDEVEAEEAEKDIPIDGVEIEDDIAGRRHLPEEEEEGDDDVADLIDGDIEDDEEVDLKLDAAYRRGYRAAPPGRIVQAARRDPNPGWKAGRTSRWDLWGHSSVGRALQWH